MLYSKDFSSTSEIPELSVVLTFGIQNIVFEKVFSFSIRNFSSYTSNAKCMNSMLNLSALHNLTESWYRTFDGNMSTIPFGFTVGKKKMFYFFNVVKRQLQSSVYNVKMN